MSEPVKTPEQERREQYHANLRRIVGLKEKYPDVHEAYLEVLREVGIGIQRNFLDTPASKYDDRIAIRTHAAVGALEEARRIIANPASFIPKPKKQVAPSVVRAGLEAVLAKARGIRDRLRAESKPSTKEDA